MKIKFFTILILAVFCTGLLFAQNNQKVEWMQWNWEVFNIRFKVPKFLKPTTKKDTKKFSATDGKTFTMNIFPWNDVQEEPQVSAKKSYNAFDAVKDKEIVSEYAVNIPGFQGYLIIGKGTNIKFERLQWFAIFGLFEPKNSLNLLVTFGWWDDPEKNEFFMDICDKIAESVKMME